MHTTKVLDHGFVTLRNIAGPTRRCECDGGHGPSEVYEFDADDVDPANAARMSFDRRRKAEKRLECAKQS